jgi:hypothetical protein
MVIIASLPQYFLQFKQFIGRTCRIGNKGRYKVILFDKTARNQVGSVYLLKKLE